jgi:ribonuclease-3
MISRFKRWFRGKPDSENRESNRELKDLEKVLGFVISPEHLTLFNRALSHRSIVDNDKYDSIATYERLEFLGDAVLDLIVTEILFDKYPQENEGFLTKMRAKIVRADTLYELARELELNKYLVIGNRAIGQGIESSKSVLSDVYEALTAAIYVSYGYERAFEFVSRSLEDYIDFDDIVTNIDNHKSLLMEYSQSEKLELPRYEILSETGPGHNKTFHVAVYIGDDKYGEGEGKSKKNAEQMAAKRALSSIMK